MSAPPLLRARGLGHRYPGAAQPSFGGLELELRRGELVLLSGPTGSGKSTALRLMAGLLAQGREGALELLGEDPATLGPVERARRVGFVAQQPHDQLVTGALGDEVAFGPECLGQASETLLPQLRPALARAGLPLQLLRPTSALSGGQTQRLAVAAALASGAPLLLLDEPLAWLDPEGARELVALLRRLADEGHGVLIVEHRLSLLRGLVDRELRLGSPGAAPPPTGDLGAPARELALGRGALPLFVGRGLGYAWPGSAGPALSGVELELRPGERLVITGPNGCGKSTLLALISGRRLGQGQIQRRGRVVEVPQDPDLALFCDSVRQELELGAAERGHPEAAGRALALAQGFDLEALLDRPPQSLSRGQRLRVAVAAALAAEPDLLLLDEPAAGQDPDQVERLMGALCRELGPAALVWVSHDLELAARWSTRQLRLEAPEAPADKPAPEPQEGLDPRAGLLLVLCAGLLALALEGPLPLALLCLLCGASLVGAPALRPHLRGVALAVLGLMWSTALSQGLFYGEQPRVALLHLGPLVLWREGLWHGLVQSLRFIAVTLAGVALALRCPADRLYLGMVGLGLHPGLSFLAATSLRALPLVAAELASVRAAWASRARPTWRRHPWAWLQVELALLRPALARSLRRARVLAESLDMRGFDPAARRSAWRPLRWGWRDSAALAPALLLTFGVLGARGLYLLYVAELYYHPALRPLLGLVRRWL